MTKIYIYIFLGDYFLVFTKLLIKICYNEIVWSLYKYNDFYFFLFKLLLGSQKKLGEDRNFPKAK